MTCVTIKSQETNRNNFLQLHLARGKLVVQLFRGNAGKRLVNRHRVVVQRRHAVLVVVGVLPVARQRRRAVRVFPVHLEVQRVHLGARARERRDESGF